MIIHWTPCYDNRPITWTQPEPDKLIIEHRGRTLAVDLSDAEIVEYELDPPVADYIHRAWREDGVLHLRMPSFGSLHEDVTIDHGQAREVTWKS